MTLEINISVAGRADKAAKVRVLHTDGRTQVGEDRILLSGEDDCTLTLYDGVEIEITEVDAPDEDDGADDDGE